jgi:hypothetical protein
MKIKPFLSRLASTFFISTVILVTPYWVAEIYLNFEYFNGLGNNSFAFTRPWEVVVRYGVPCLKCFSAHDAAILIIP